MYDLTGDLVQAADFDLSDGGFNASAMGTAGGQYWLAGSFETGSNAPANEGGRDALWCSIDWSDLSLGEPQTFGGPDSDDISYLGKSKGVWLWVVSSQGQPPATISKAKAEVSFTHWAPSHWTFL